MLRQDCYGRASFALLALAILLLANMSMVYLFKVQRESAELAAQANEIEAMREVCALTDRQVESAAHYIAMGVIRNARFTMHNRTWINGLFSESFSGFIVDTFPIDTRGFRVAVDDHQVVILTATKSVEDVLRTSTVTMDTVATEDTELLDNGNPGGLERVERVAYYRLSGHVNYTVSNWRTQVSFSEGVDDELDSPLPFIDQNLARLSNAVQGPFSEFGQMLRYILGTVAQQRVLYGYSGGEYGRAGMRTTDILSPRDVEMAVNLVLILEQIRYFRAFDEESVRQFDQVYFADYAGSLDSIALIPPAVNRTLAKLLASYAGNGTIDPADLFVLFTANDRDNVPLNRVLAQALYGMMDQLVLKYLDYVDFFPLQFVADFGLWIVETLANAWQDFCDWITGNDREAMMVREYVKDLFNELGFAPQVGGRAFFLLPAQTYAVTNGDGASYTISVPAWIHSVQFGYVQIAEGFDDVWKAYYGVLFANDLKEVHSGVKDLGRDIARSLANEMDRVGLFEPIVLNGHVNPNDDEGMLEYIERRIVSSIDAVLRNLRDNPQYFTSLVQNLWQKEKTVIRNLVNYIEGNYEVFLNPAFATFFTPMDIGISIMNLAKSDPDFSLLDGAGLEDLGAQVQQAIAANGWVQVAYNAARSNDLARFEALYEKAVGMDTPPEQGGLYRRLVEAVAGATGVISDTGQYVRFFISAFSRNRDVSNSKILIPAYVGPFKFYDSEEDDVGGRAEERFIVRQTPAVLPTTRLTRQGRLPDRSPQVGEFWVDVLDPSTIPASPDSPNIHYTQPDRISQTPYETQWTVLLKGAVKVRVSTSRGVYVDPEGHVPAEDEALIPLGATVVIKTFSGWPLERVAYASSDTLMEDLKQAILDFLANAWGAATRVLSWVLDGVDFLVDQLKGLVDFVSGLASKVLEIIYDILSKLVDFLIDVVRTVGSFLMSAIDFIASHLPSFAFDISAFGLRIHIEVNGPGGNRLLLSAAIESCSLLIRVVNLDEAGLRTNPEQPVWDVLASWHVDAGPFRTDGLVDPFMMVSDRILMATASWENSWKLNLTMPEIEAYYEWGYDFGFSIQTPLGEADVEIGLSMRLTEPSDGIDVIGAIVRSVGEAERDAGEFDASWEWFQRLAAHFVRRLVDNLLEEVESELERVIDVTFYVEGVFRLADAAGMGGRLSLVVDGESVRALFSWLARNIKNLVDKLLNPNADFSFEGLPQGVLSHVYIIGEVLLSVGLPGFVQDFLDGIMMMEIGVSLALGANVAAFGALAGLDWGPWEVVFGACLAPFPPMVANPIFGTGDRTVDVWILQGAITPA